MDAATGKEAVAAQEARLQQMLEAQPEIGEGLRKVSLKKGPADLATSKQTSVETKKRAMQSLTSQLADAYAKKNFGKGKKART